MTALGDPAEGRVIRALALAIRDQARGIGFGIDMQKLFQKEGANVNVTPVGP